MLEFQHENIDNDYKEIKDLFEDLKFPEDFIVAGHQLSERSSSIVKSMLLSMTTLSNPQKYTHYITSIIKALDEVAKDKDIDEYDNSEFIQRLEENNLAIQQAVNIKGDLLQLSLLDMDSAYRNFQQISENFVEFMDNLEVIISNLKAHDVFLLPEQFKESFEQSLNHVERLKSMLFMPLSISSDSNLSELLGPSWGITTPQQQVLTPIPMALAAYLSSVVPEFINVVNNKIVKEVMEKVSFHDFLAALNESDSDFPSTRLGMLIDGLQAYKEAQGKLETNGCLNYQYEIATPLISLWQKGYPELIKKLDPYFDLMKELGGGLFVGGNIKEGELSIDLYYPVKNVNYKVDSIFADDYSLLDSFYAQQKEYFDKVKFNFSLNHGNQNGEKTSYQIMMSLFNDYEGRREISQILLALKNISKNNVFSSVEIDSITMDSGKEDIIVSIVPKDIERISFFDVSQKKGLLFNSETLGDYDVQEYVSKINSLIKVMRLDMLHGDDVSIKDVRDRLGKVLTIASTLNKISNQELCLICDCFCEDEKVVIVGEDGVPIFSLDLNSGLSNIQLAEKIDSIFETLSLFGMALFKGESKIDLNKDSGFVSEKFFANLRNLNVICSDAVKCSLLINFINSQRNFSLFEKIFFRNLSELLQGYIITRDKDGTIYLDMESSPIRKNEIQEEPEKVV